MQIKVGELPEYLAKRDESSVTAKLGNFEVTDDATTLVVKNGTETQFALDEKANGALSKYLGVPYTYLKGLDPDFRASLYRYEFNRRPEITTVVEALNNDIIAVHQPSQAMLPLGRVVEVVTKVLKPEDTIRRLITDDARFHLDATTTEHAVTLSDTHESLVRGGVEVGDITEAGFRVLAYPFQSKPPAVMTYAERLVCMNGQTTEERLGRINLKGRTVDEVIASMEEAAQQVLGQLDEYLDRLAATRDMTVPGNPQAFAAQLAKEAGVGIKVLSAVLDKINQLPAPVTVWDINQAFTSVANEVERYSTMTRLQTLGGHLAFNGERMVDRCNACERLL